MNKKVLFFTFIISCILVLLSPFIFPVEVTNFSQLKALRFGFPFPFIEQASTFIPDRKDFPLSLTMLNPLENVTQILIGNLALSILNVMVIYLVGWFLFKTIVLKRKRVIRSKVNN